MSAVLSGGIFMQLLCAQMFIALSFLQVDMVRSQVSFSIERQFDRIPGMGKSQPVAAHCRVLQFFQRIKCLHLLLLRNEYH